MIHSITELTFAEAAGKGVYDNFYTGMPWYWHLKDKYPGAKRYYDRHHALRKRAPSGYAASSYSTVRVLLDAAREVKSLETPKILGALEGRKFQYLKGPEYIRTCDHVNIQDVYLCRGKSSAAMKDFRSLSHRMNSRPPSSAGELPVPQPIIIGCEPRSFFQSGLPDKS